MREIPEGVRTEVYYYYHYQSPIGRLTLASNEQSIVGLWMDQQRYYMDILEGQECREEETAVICQAEKWLDQYFRQEKPALEELPIEWIGSDFRKQVWQLLAEIPYGETVTYGDIARQIARQRGVEQMSAQAVGGAVGRNPISIIIPCHRVVGSGGSLTGYSGGIRTKLRLLELEGAVPIQATKCAHCTSELSE